MPEQDTGFSEALALARRFRDERDWAQFHNPKDLAASIAVEAGELLETFQWSGADLQREDRRAETVDELADVLLYCVYLADALGVDAPTIMADKLARNEGRYPTEKARGNARKWSAE